VADATDDEPSALEDDEPSELEEALLRDAGIVPAVDLAIVTDNVRWSLFGAPRSVAKAGRYVALSRIGEGGTGLVYDAYDPLLDRRVAIKLLQAGGREAEEAAKGLLANARGMAQLHHPNAVRILDAGISEGSTTGYSMEVYVVMEKVEGTRLDRWLEEKERTADQKLAVFRGAGAALAAAHALGIIHRDFKAQNVLVRPTGSPVVVDFAILPPPEADYRPLEAGTQGLMAPEQEERGDCSPASDQFTFCASLALAFKHPNVGDPLETQTLRIDKWAGPRWLRPILQRGLSKAPAVRFPSMEDLLVKLRRRRRRSLWVTGAGLAVALGAALAYGQYARTQDQLCSDSQARLAGVWDGDQRQAVRDAILATAVSYRDDTSQRVELILDDYTTTWSAAHREACEATQIRHEQSAGRMHLRMACLEQLLWEVEGLVKVLATANEKVVENAIGAATSLTQVKRCTGDELPVGIEVPDAAGAPETVASLRARIAEAKGLEDAARYKDGVAIAEQVVNEAIEVGYPPLVAEARYRLGSLKWRAGRYAEAEMQLLEATWAAEEARLDEIAARAQTLLVVVVGHHQARYQEGRLWARSAEAKLGRLSGAEDIEAELLAHRGVLNDETARYEEATRQLKQALSMRLQIFGPSHPLVAVSLNQLGNVYYQQHMLDEAYEQYVSALEIREQVFGPSHPSVATMYNNVGIVLQSKGDNEAALAQHERALAIWQETLDPDHPSMELSYHNLAIALEAAGEHERSRKQYEEALAINVRVHGADHPRTALVHAHLGLMLMFLGEPEAAREHSERALEIWGDKHGTEHPDYAYALTVLGEWFRHQQDLKKALDLQTQALAIRERAFPPSHGSIAESLMRVGRLHVRMGRADPARPLLLRALEITGDAVTEPYPDTGVILRELGRILLREGHRQEGMDHLESALVRHEQFKRGFVGDLAETRFLLAQTLWEAGDETRAREQAQEARTELDKAGATQENLAAEVEAWLAKHE
jgi:tetratricopeptide (TPR) repeat protein